jgi:predicted GNAT family N-acyltransferase
MASTEIRIMQTKIYLFTYFRDLAGRTTFLNLLAQGVPALGAHASCLPTELVKIPENEPENRAVEIVTKTLAEAPGAIGVLLSDLLITGQRVPMPTPFARACASRFSGERLGTIAIAPRPQRVEDIDRTLHPSCDPDTLARALCLVTGRLDFLQVPKKQSPIQHEGLTVRPLRENHVGEFGSYFKLRHKIYTIMGYLDEQTEQTRSHFEINEADTHAIHIGAFFKTENREILVGTARVVTTTEPNESLRSMFKQLAIGDPALRKRLDIPYDLTLPVFQSHKLMTPIMLEAIRADVVCGELSRVIVESEFRGMGLSRRLIHVAVESAIRAGASRLFLECLPSHETLYVRHGFHKLDGVQGPVVDVRRTMLAMEMDPRVMEASRSRLSGMPSYGQQRPTSASVSV